MKEKQKQPRITGSLKKLVLSSTEFRGHVLEFEQWLRVFGFADSTVVYSPLYVSSFLHNIERSGIQSIAMLTNNHVKTYMSFLNKVISFRTGNKLSQNYKLNHRNAIKLFSKFLKNSKDFHFDATYRSRAGSSDNRKWLTQHDIKLLYGACLPDKKGEMNRAILGIYYGLGLRRQEGVSLDLRNIQWNNGLMYVKVAKLQQERFVPLSSRIKSDLESYINIYRNPLLHKLGKSYEQALLISEQGIRITGAAVYCRLQNLACKSGLEIPLSLHTLRHSIATHFLENGLSLEYIAKVLGHRSLESTQIYTHLIHKNFKDHEPKQ